MAIRLKRALQCALACALLCALTPRADAHDASLSRTLLVVDGPRVSQFVKLQTLSVGEVLPLDADGNSLVTRSELDAVADQLLAYLVEHHRLTPVSAAGVGPNLPGRLVALELVTDDADALSFSQWIEVELERTAPAAFRQLAVDMSLFADTSPGHRDGLDVVWRASDGDPGASMYWSAELWVMHPAVLMDTGARSAGEVAWLAWGRLLARPAAVGVWLLVLLTCRRDRTLASLLAAGLGLGAGVGLAPWLAPSLPALPLAAGLALVALGAVAWLRRSPRPMGLEAGALGALMGLHLAAAPALLGPLSAHWLAPAGSSAAGPPASSEGLWLAAGMSWLAAALLAGTATCLPGRRLGTAAAAVPGQLVPEGSSNRDPEGSDGGPGAGSGRALVPAWLVAPVAGAGVVLGGYLAWLAG